MSNEQPTPPALPPEVREAIDAAAKKINWRLNTTHYVDIAGIIRDELAPLWPRPVTVTARIKPDHAAADAFWAYWRENGETHKHGYYESTWGAINAALAVAGQASTPAPVTADARELAEKVYRIAMLACGRDGVLLQGDVPGIEAIAAILAPVLARAEAAERELARWIEQLSLETNAGPTGDLMATSRAWQAVRREREDLRAEVERLTFEWKKQRLALNRIAHPEAWAEAKGHNPKEIARRALIIGIKVQELPDKKEGDYDDLRTQLAVAQEALERIATYDAPDTQAMIEIARAARRQEARHD